MEGDPKALGQTRAMISKAIVGLQAEYYGKGPTKAKTYIDDDLVVVVLEESFTRDRRVRITASRPPEHHATLGPARSIRCRCS